MICWLCRFHMDRITSDGDHLHPMVVTTRKHLLGSAARNFARYRNDAISSIELKPIDRKTAEKLVVEHHYLHSMAGGTQLCFGVFSQDRLAGVITFGVGPANAHRLFANAKPRDCLTLTRLWLADELPSNSESRVIGLALRALKRHTDVKFVLSYADPSAGHVGIIYQATNWIYAGLSEAMPLYDLGDGVPRHSRTFSHAFGTHSTRHFANHGIDVKVIPQSSKHRYVCILDRRWRRRLLAPRLAYPKGVTNERD